MRGYYLCTSILVLVVVIYSKTKSLHSAQKYPKNMPHCAKLHCARAFCANSWSICKISHYCKFSTLCKVLFANRWSFFSTLYKFSALCKFIVWGKFAQCGNFYCTSLNFIYTLCKFFWIPYKTTPVQIQHCANRHCVTVRSYCIVL